MQVIKIDTNQFKKRYMFYFIGYQLFKKMKKALDLYT